MDMPISVQVLCGPVMNMRPMHFTCGSSDTVAELKLQIRDSLRVFVWDQRLLLAEHELEDGTALWDCLRGPGEPIVVTLLCQPTVPLVLCGGIAAEGAALRLALYDGEAQQPLQAFGEPQDTVCCLAVDWQGQRALSGGWEPTIRFWDLNTARTVQHLHGHMPGVFCISADWANSRAASGGDDYTVRVWDLVHCSLLQTLVGHKRPVHSVALDCNSRRVLSGSQDRTLRLWNLETGELITTMNGHSGTVFSINVDWPWCKALTGSWDTSLRLWNLENGQIEKELRHHKNAVLATAMSYATCQAVSSGTDNILCVWDLDSCKCVRQIPSPDEKSGTIQSLEADWSAGRIYAASTDGTLRLFDLNAGTVLQNFHTDLEAVRCLQVRWPSSDGQVQPAALMLPSVVPR